MQEKRASEPLSIDQFLSAFLLLVLGTLSSVVLLLLEHLYVRYMRPDPGPASSQPATSSTCFSFIRKVRHGDRKHGPISSCLELKWDTCYWGHPVTLYPVCE